MPAAKHPERTIFSRSGPACGNSSITIEPERIVIDAPAVHVQAIQRIELLQGDPPAASLVLAGAASLAGGTASIVGGGKGGGKLFLDADAHLDGGLVKLNCGPAGGAAAKRVAGVTTRSSVTFKVERDGLPPDVDRVTLVIAAADGSTVERDCAVGGSVTLEGLEGDVFTVIETRFRTQPLALRKTASDRADSE